MALIKLQMLISSKNVLIKLNQNPHVLFAQSHLNMDLTKWFYTSDCLDISEQVWQYAWLPYKSISLMRIFNVIFISIISPHGRQYSR